MANNNIINILQSLINILEYIIDDEKIDKTYRLKTSFRIKSLKNSVNIIKNYPKKITENNYTEVFETVKEFMESSGNYGVTISKKDIQKHIGLIVKIWNH